MTKEKKTVKVKGGFRSTLALLISIIALIVAVIAYNRTGGDMDMQKQLNELQGTMEKMKGELAQLQSENKDLTERNAYLESILHSEQGRFANLKEEHERMTGKSYTGAMNITKFGFSKDR